MRPLLHTLIILLASCISLSAATAGDTAAKPATAAPPRQTIALVSAAARAIREIAALPNRKIPPVLLKEATAVIIVPGAAKKSFMVSGGRAGGMLLVRDTTGAWSSPVFITLSGGTLGWQIVGDPMDIILLFRKNRQIDAILKGRLTLDTKTAIVPGRAALTMKGATREELEAEVTSYVRSHGVFEEDAVVAGTTVEVDQAANDSLYGRAHVDVREILAGSVTKSGDELTALQKVLTGYATAK